MPIEIGLWRIEEGLKEIQEGSMDLEEHLEDFLEKDITIASPDWLVIGRQVMTDYGHRIDLLALNRDGDLVVLELKRNMTPRDAVAQVLDYGSWVCNLKDEDIASIFRSYVEKHKPEWGTKSLDDTFKEHFDVSALPETLNTNHHLVIVASALDPMTERIVNYLADIHSVTINAVFFRVFQDDERHYLSRAWFRDPIQVESETKGGKKPWNGEVYVSFGHDDRQDWDDAVKYGYISAYGGLWYTRTMDMLEPGQRLWVNIPNQGYVGVGEVVSQKVPVEDFVVRGASGEAEKMIDMPLNASKTKELIEDPAKAQYLVGVRWIKTLPLSEAVKEKGFFGNQNTVCKPRDKKWNHTVTRLKELFGVK